MKTLNLDGSTGTDTTYLLTLQSKGMRKKACDRRTDDRCISERMD
jgi:hypothetical protein